MSEITREQVGKLVVRCSEFVAFYDPKQEVGHGLIHECGQALAALQDENERLRKDLSECVKQEVYVTPDKRSGVFAERVGQRDGSFLWAVRDDFGGAMDREGVWWVEPTSSERTDDYLAQARWATREQAVQAAREAFCAAREGA